MKLLHKEIAAQHEKMTESSVSLSTNAMVCLCVIRSAMVPRDLRPAAFFFSFVLLKDAAWCASAFVKRFRREWDNSIELEDGASSSTSCFIVDDVPVFIRLIPHRFLIMRRSVRQKTISFGEEIKFRRRTIVRT